MANFCLIVQYDGTRYNGWQRQGNTPDTIQEKLELILEHLYGQPVEVNGSGRTDGGVHARGQTASVILSGKAEEETFLSVLNEKLPEDVRVLQMELVKNGFHARYSARGKCYE